MMIYICFYDQTAKEQEHDTAYRLLQLMLEREYDITEYSIGRTSHGKPFLQSHPHIRINLSHCKGMAVCAAGDAALGVDCEGVRGLREGVVRRVCTSAEADMLRCSLSPDLDFTRLWTLKESFVKAVGRGVSYPMRNAEFLMDGSDIRTNITGASFCQYVFADRYVLSLCSAEPECRPAVYIVSADKLP